jgi:ketosteroid isomerase-like protein
MGISRQELIDRMDKWNRAWDEHDLDGVMALFHEDIVFENWTGGRAEGWQTLHDAWKPWFENHGGFRFIPEDLFFDEAEQKVLFRWTLEWPSREKGHEGEPEKRRGVDVIHFRDGKIIEKLTYAKTRIEIGGTRYALKLAD